MKKIILMIILLNISHTVQAAYPVSSEVIKTTLEAQPSCENFVRYDSTNLYLGFGAYKYGWEEPRYPIPAKVRVAPFDSSAPFELATKDAAIDLVTVGDTAFVLTYSSIEEWNLKTRSRVAEYETYAFNHTMAYMQHAQSMILYKNKLVIAHGRLGVSIFDLKTRHLENQFKLVTWQSPLESSANGITVQGKYAYIVLDNISLVSQGKPAFRGIVILDLETESVVAELDGIDPGTSDILADDKKVIVSFRGNPIWKYSLTSLQAKQLPEPEIRIWQFPIKGNPTGSARMDDKYYYTCFSKAPAHPGENGGRYTNIPMALDRRVLILN